MSTCPSSLSPLNRNQGYRLCNRDDLKVKVVFDKSYPATASSILADRLATPCSRSQALKSFKMTKQFIMKSGLTLKGRVLQKFHHIKYDFLFLSLYMDTFWMDNLKHHFTFANKFKSKYLLSPKVENTPECGIAIAPISVAVVAKVIEGLKNHIHVKSFIKQW